ncbi:CobW family GTP-binding protein [Stutzerimonas azotifigens]|uniref:GTP-binding protein n=1 Tax=Stutzerimonas azotifigens TaxID=291995 RepID=A0ABR5Z747_9GAMM|nr:CobW family GTP-binding protein [Stutzerimonas azotifigens]MBA1275959.1 GTP-binding protein [Stutzerimonas azotifigens]
MLKNIPTHLIAGPLGAGKTSLIRTLLAQKPSDERWAILINEFGLIGLDAALLHQDAAGVSLTEVAGGCLCCVNGLPFQVGLIRLLREARPDRLLIEPSGLGHPLELLRQLREAPWRGVLDIQPALMVLDARALAAGDPLPIEQAQAAEAAGLLVLNKSAALSERERTLVLERLPARPFHWSEQGALLLSQLPTCAGADKVEGDGELPAVPAAQPGTLWTSPDAPICQVQEQPEGWSIGWRWHPSQRFDLLRLQRWLHELGWRRAKLVIHAEQGWYAANALVGQEPSFSPSAWRRDSRIELIFDRPQPKAQLMDALAACRLEG